MTKTINESEKLAALCAKSADAIKAENISILKVGELTTVADYFVICTGNSTPQLRAISDEVIERVKRTIGKRASVLSGDAQSGWMAMDYGSVIVHVFSKETRDKYQLEALWSDAPRIEALKVLEEKTKKKRKSS
jgi:ribosome-associated protein